MCIHGLAFAILIYLAFSLVRALCDEGNGSESQKTEILGRNLNTHTHTEVGAFQNASQAIPEDAGGG